MRGLLGLLEHLSIFFFFFFYRTFYSQSMEETVEEEMAAKGKAMFFNLGLGIVGKGEFGVEMKDGVEVFYIKHCVQEMLTCLIEGVRGQLKS